MKKALILLISVAFVFSAQAQTTINFKDTAFITKGCIHCIALQFHTICMSSDGVKLDKDVRVLVMKKNTTLLVTGVVQEEKTSDWTPGRTSQTYKDGILNGVHKEWSLKHGGGLQLRSEGNWKDGELDGVWKEWYNNGQLESERTSKNGKLHGGYEKWLFSGELEYEGNYKDGKKDGVWKYWSKSGFLDHEFTFIDNKKVSYSYLHWHKNGNLKSDKKGIVYGAHSSKEWYESGRLKEEASYKNSLLDGMYKEWHENGQLHRQGNYKDGKKDGVWKSWFENGQLDYETTF